MLKTLDEKLEDGFIRRAEKLVEDVQAQISTESVKDAFFGLEAIHKKYFPNSEFNITLSSFGLPMIYFKSTVHKRSQWSGGIIHNDPMLSAFTITYKKDGKYTMELTQGDGLAVNPPVGSFYAMKHVRVQFRKATGTPESLMKKYEDWEKKRKEVYDENKDNIYGMK